MDKMNTPSTILVTGGTGYIGSHTVVELINKGFQVAIIDNLSNSHIEVIDSIEAITGTRPFFANIDLNNKSAVQEFLRIHQVSAIIHFAAFKAVGESETNHFIIQQPGITHQPVGDLPRSEDSQFCILVELLRLWPA